MNDLSGGNKERSMQIMLIFSLIVAIIAVIFAVQNADTTNIQFLFWEKEVPIAAALLAAVLLGVLMSVLASSPSSIRRKLTIRNQRKQIAELETSLANQNLKLAEANQKATDLENQFSDKAAEKPVEKTAEATQAEEKSVLK
jgi:uncharacterized integral membrane protein